MSTQMRRIWCLAEMSRPSILNQDNASNQGTGSTAMWSVENDIELMIRLQLQQAGANAPSVANGEPMDRPTRQDIDGACRSQ